MKCPYQKDDTGMFMECTTECPACRYEIHEYETVDGRKPSYWSVEKAIEEGTMWRTKRSREVIIGCKFADELVKPTDQNITKVNNVHKTSTTLIKNSIF